MYPVPFLSLISYLSRGYEKWECSTSTLNDWTFLWALLLTIFDALRDFVLFAQCEKREKHPWKSDTKSITSPLVFFTFFKLNKWYKIAQSISVDLELSDIKGLVEKGIINWVTHQFSKVLKMCGTYSERLLKVDP